MFDSEESLEGKTEWVDSFRLHHPLDRAALMGVDGAAYAKEMLTKRAEERENLTGQSESAVKDSFTGSATIFKQPDGTLYAMVHTEWLGVNGKEDEETTSWDVRVPLTEAQLQTMREAREAYKKRE